MLDIPFLGRTPIAPSAKSFFREPTIEQLMLLYKYILMYVIIMLIKDYALAS